MPILGIDIETYSDLDLSEVGVYRYVEHESFQVLMIAWAFDDGPVQIWSIDEGYANDKLAELRAIAARSTTKTAYNAQFERTCLAKHFEQSMPPEQWRCTMVHAATLGLPGSLGKVAEVMGLPADMQKDKAGSDLIKYFCMPCKPTLSNGMRTRNLPLHNPDGWDRFKEYCKQDVVTERAVRKQLEAFPLNQEEQQLWCLDQAINDAGISMDRAFIERAIALDTEYQERLVKEATALTGLQNPNSRNQLLDWINSQPGMDATTLTKADIPDLVAQTDDPRVHRLLEIRQEMSKSSNSKYYTMERVLQNDDRVRGLFQFYGANRTGRWAGRLIQPQNLRRNDLEDIGYARDLIKTGRFKELEFLYGDPSDTLSQLLRTAFIPSPGNLLYVADFSAIEAVVLSWISQEEWRMEVFNTHGKIYEASASQMFRVPLESIAKGKENYSLRAKGKIAELALGYGGGEGALEAMGALNMGLEKHELDPLVKLWRSTNPKIVDFWWAVENAAVNAVRSNRATQTHGLVFRVDRGSLFIDLPSGRSLAYHKPHLKQGKYGKDQLMFWGVDQTKKVWRIMDTYGPKIVENCLAGDSLVATNSGWVRLDAISTSMKVYDGVEFVKHSGLTQRPSGDTISVDGVRMTPDHKVLTEEGWKHASQIKGLNREPVRMPDSDKLPQFRWEESILACPMRLRKRKGYTRRTLQNNPVVWLSNKSSYRVEEHNAWNVKASGILGVALNGGSLHFKKPSSLHKLRGQRHNCVRVLENQLRDFLAGYGGDLHQRAYLRPRRQRSWIFKSKLPLDFLRNTITKQKKQYFRLWKNTERIVQRNRHITKYAPLPVCTRRKGFTVDKDAGRNEPVFDLMNCGPRNRFVVLGEAGPFIVHNCVQAIARDCLGHSMCQLDQRGYGTVMHVHDEVIIDGPKGINLDDIIKVMAIRPQWAQTLPLKAAGYTCEFYQKD